MNETETALRLDKPGELADLLAETACLPAGEYGNGVFIYHLTVDGHTSRLYYILKPKPYRLQRVLVGDWTDGLRVPKGFIHRMSNIDAEAYVKMTKFAYAHLAKQWSKETPVIPLVPSL